MFVWLNIGSLILGLVAWTLPIINIMLCRRDIRKNWAELSMLSISACVISLGLQIFYTCHLVNIEDWSALMDTNWAVASISGILLVVTLVLNIITYVLYREK